MKNKMMKYLFAGIALFAVMSCVEEDRDISYVQNVQGPENLALTFNVTQDNTGNVSILPSAENADSFKVFFWRC